MENHTAYTAPATSYKEVRIGNTIYRVTSFFSGEKDLENTGAAGCAPGDVGGFCLCCILRWPCHMTLNISSRPAASLRGGGVLSIIFLQGYTCGATTPRWI